MNYSCSVSDDEVASMLSIQSVQVDTTSWQPGQTSAYQLHQAPIQRTASDDAQHDTLFPDHPLSRGRAALTQLEASLVLDRELLQAAPYRKVARVTEQHGWLKRLRNRFK
jgi:hypothetical protein